MSKTPTRPWYVYIVECADKSLYTGVTTDVDRRVNEHNSDTKSARYTRARQPVRLAYTELSKDRSSACKREYAIKQFSRSMKIKLINGDTKK